jgi:predicted sulfurtransferase
MEQSRAEVLLIREGLNASISNLSSQIDTMAHRMEQQNSSY